MSFNTYEDCLKDLSFILEKQLVPSVAGARQVGRDGREMAVNTSDLPMGCEQDRTNLLFNKAAVTQRDQLVYSVNCYNRAKGPLTSVMRQVTVSTVLEMLTQACNTSGADFWGDLYGSPSVVNSVHESFLSVVSGWSESAMSADMLNSIAQQATASPQGRAAVRHLIRAGCSKLKNTPRIEELLLKESTTLAALDNLSAQAAVIDILGNCLSEELQYANGLQFERESLWADLLSVSLLLDKVSQNILSDKRLACFTEMRNFPDVSLSDIDALHGQIQDALHGCHKTLHSTLLKMFKSPHKNTVLNWLAKIVNVNIARAGPRFKRSGASTELGACSDGIMVNLCAVLLELCRPFFTSSPDGGKLALIDRSYPMSPHCRLQLGDETCLAHGIIGGGPVGTTGEGGFKFVCELFFITSWCLHIGLLPAVNQFTSNSGDLSKQLLATNMPPKLKEINSLFLLCGTSSLMDPQLVTACSQFFITQAVWITKQIQDTNGDGQAKALSGIPEYMIKDMAVWFRFIVFSKPQLLQGLQLTPFVDCCVWLLERPDLLPSGLSQARLVSVLLACLSSDRRGQKRLLSSDMWSGIHGELSVAVQASPSVRDKLCPALLHTYAAVNVVEGLDVDKENFDKFSTRFEVAQLLLRLWTRDDCKSSVLRECGSKRFVEFIGAMLDTLLYQLGDGLSRLVNVRKYESLKEEWTSLPERQRREKELFLASEQRAAKGFMSQATLQLELFHEMIQTTPVASVLSQGELPKRITATCLGFLDTLCGSKSAELKVKDMASYSFAPKTLVRQIASVLLRGWAHDKTTVFIKCLAEHPEYSGATLSKCREILSTESTELSQKFGNLLQEVGALQSMDTVVVSEDNWQEYAEASVVDQDGLCELYTAALSCSKYETSELMDVHILADKLAPTLDPRSPKVRAIIRDMKQMEESLPIHPDSAIFVRQDEDRMDLVRVLITGPVDTPYSRGCFVFDVLYPASYPTNPPLVFMTTTGGGTIRFNPNLYADGKVCLSLLGTWHGGDASEKWDPLQSNLMQVLLSIQSMIMIPDPMFNEPGYEAIRGTPQGNSRGQLYNADIQVHTVRYAMLEQLRNPPKGFEDVIAVHFAMCQEVLLKQLSRWLKEAVSPEHHTRLKKAINEFRAELEKT